MEKYHDLCKKCAACYVSPRNKGSSSRLRDWVIPEDYKNNCSFCRFVVGLKHKKHARCDKAAHVGVSLSAEPLPSDDFVRPPIDATFYLKFRWSCDTSLWYFFEDDKNRIDGTIGFAYQVNPQLDKTDWNVIRQWVDGCMQRHQSSCICRDPFDVPGFEVIDCNTRKLVPWDRKADFAALSYVWGSAQTRADRSKNLPETQEDRTILPNPFPESVIEDAYICTLKLNIRYLWVDRYCIDQKGTNERKQRLIQSMDKIYSAAKVTIINVAGKDAPIGLPGVSGTLRISSSKMVINGHTKIPVVNPNKEISSSKWAKRGWTLQEGLLARRRLVFTNTGVYFQCTQSHYVEGLSGEFHSKKKVHYLPDFNYPRMATQAFLSSVIGSDTSDFSMMSVCDDFTTRDLKTDEDALNACLGIFSRFWTSTKPEYQYCGLPFQAESNAAIALSLLWRAYSRTSGGLITFRRDWGPSWSWLALRGHLHFGHSKLQNSGKQFKTLIDIKVPRRHEEQDVMSTISDYIGDINRGGLFQHWLPYLRLSGWIATMRFEYWRRGSDAHSNGKLRCCVAKGQDHVGTAQVLPHMWAKVLNDSEAFKTSRLLDVIFIADDGTDIHCLVIRRVGEATANTFERLGTCEIFYDSPEIKQNQNLSYLSAREGKWHWEYLGKRGEVRTLGCRFDTITLV